MQKASKIILEQLQLRLDFNSVPTHATNSGKLENAILQDVLHMHSSVLKG